MDFNEEELLDENNGEMINEDELVEEPAYANSFSDAPVEPTKANTKKANIPKIFKNPYFWAVLGIGVLITLVAILIFQMDWDLYGVDNPRPKTYENLPACGKVYLTWEDEEYLKKHNLAPTTNPLDVDLSNTERFHYEEYDYDTFVTGIIWTDNRNALDLDNQIVYQAMAIAARSRLIATLPNNCVVLRDYNEQAKSFTKLDGTEEKYKEISEAVKETNGIIITRNKQAIEAFYEPFSYVKKIKSQDDNYKDVFFYHMMNKNKERQLMIPANWVDEVENKKGQKLPKIKVNDVKELFSMSLYGSKYLLEQVDSQYELYRILETFYGRDIEYSTTNKNLPNNNFATYGAMSCMWWPIGSSETTVDNGITYAKGEAETYKITSEFGYRNISLANASTNHQAIDIAGGVEGQTNIIAVADGEVIDTNTGCTAGDLNCGGRLGNYVKIKHSDGTITRYGHMYNVSVTNGSSVKQGQVIGKMGNTGNSTGTHLDFQIIVNGVKVNPLSYVSYTNSRITCNVSYSGGSYAGGSNKEFIEFIAPYAVQDMKSSGILASVTIAQAILESNWGKSGLSKNYNNYFGMKAGSSWTGKTVDISTTECDASGCHSGVPATWRVYESPIFSIQDHSRLLHSNRYKDVVGVKDYERAITIIKNGGYATDPNYVSKIVSLIESNNLAEYDKM